MVNPVISIAMDELSLGQDLVMPGIFHRDLRPTKIDSNPARIAAVAWFSWLPSASAGMAKKRDKQTDRREVFLRLLRPFEPLTVGGLGTMVHLWLKSLNLKLPRYGPHALRHACASHLLAEGLTVTAVART